MSLENRYHFAQQLIQEAGKKALAYYQQRHHLSIECKEGDKLDEVSIADKNVELFIRAQIAAQFPADGFFGEEFGHSSLDQPFCWIVDPIDGTSPFLHGLHAWCISISLLHKKEIVAGLIYDPLHEELFHAQKGQGAYLNQERMFTAQQAVSFSDGLIGLGMSHRAKPEQLLPLLHGVLTEKGMFVRNGSGALTLAQVAAGRLIAYFEPHMNVWDSSAGALLVREAGGVASPILENEGLTKGNYVLATATPTLYQKLDQLYQRLIIKTA